MNTPEEINNHDIKGFRPEQIIRKDVLIKATVQRASDGKEKAGDNENGVLIFSDIHTDEPRPIRVLTQGLDGFPEGRINDCPHRN